MTKHSREYEKSHPWLTFRLDLRDAPPAFWIALGECQSKCEHISGVPLRPDIARTLHQVYLAKGVWGTTAIEGNTLSEEEVLKHLDGKLNVPPSKEYLKQEIDNIINESNRMLETIHRGESLVLTVPRIKEINRAMLHRLTLEPGVTSGEIRAYSVGVMNYRGAPAKDCEYLFEKLCDWLNGPDFQPQAGLGSMHMAILKAIIGHLYVEWIHGFGDGNGRTGRLIEAQMLLAEGVPSPASHLLSNHYNLTRQEYLRQLRAASESGGKVMPFLAYAVTGFVDGLKEQIAYIRQLHLDVAWLNYIHEVFHHQNTRAAARQKALILDISTKSDPVPMGEMDQVSPRVAKLYAGMHARTCSRDVDLLKEKGLLISQGNGYIANQSLIRQFLPVKAKGQSATPNSPATRE